MANELLRAIVRAELEDAAASEGGLTVAKAKEIFLRFARAVSPPDIEVIVDKDPHDPNRITASLRYRKP